MVAGQNCWEFKKCGREPEGTKIAKLGVCPTTTVTFADGINGGKNGGRICWAIAGTFSGGIVIGIFARKIFSCKDCDFFNLVKKEEGIDNFELLTPVKLHQLKLQTYGERKFMRFNIYLDIELNSTKEVTEYLDGVTRNISFEGFSFVSENFNVKPKEKIKFSIKHPRKDMFVSVLGDIIWKRQVGDKCLMGVIIRDIENEIKDEILDYAYDRWIGEIVFFQK